jgi:hypothetical protein
LRKIDIAGDEATYESAVTEQMETQMVHSCPASRESDEGLCETMLEPRFPNMEGDPINEASRPHTGVLDN